MSYRKVLKSARVKRPLATTILRAELREGLETMTLSRPQLKIAAALAALFVLLLSSSAHAQPVDDHTITAEGIGNAVLGLSPAELIEALGPDYQVGDEVRITIDFDGRVVSRNGTVQFRAAMTDDTETLTLFMVSNPEYTTAEGIGPTSTIAEAEAVYGPAMLAWNPDNSSRLRMAPMAALRSGPQVSAVQTWVSMPAVSSRRLRTKTALRSLRYG